MSSRVAAACLMQMLTNALTRHEDDLDRLDVLMRELCLTATNNNKKRFLKKIQKNPTENGGKTNTEKEMCFLQALIDHNQHRGDEKMRLPSLHTPTKGLCSSIWWRGMTDSSAPDSFKTCEEGDPAYERWRSCPTAISAQHSLCISFCFQHWLHWLGVWRGPRHRSPCVPE